MVLGGTGQLGRMVIDRLVESNMAFIAPIRSEIDVCDEKAVLRLAEIHGVKIIVNCAAWTAVDLAETHVEDALRINADAPHSLARVSLKTGCKVIHISTDYVFDGEASRPYKTKDHANPRNRYGQSKLLGELAITSLPLGTSSVIRTSWLYSRYRSSFVKTMTSRALRGERVNVVNDQVGQPTSAFDLSLLVYQVSQLRHFPTILHGSNTGATTWFDLTRTIYEFLGCDLSLVAAITTESLSLPAYRPRYTVLDHSEFSQFGLKPLRSWETALFDELPNIVQAVRGSHEDRKN